VDDLKASHGIVAGITGVATSVISWFSMRDKCDKDTCTAVHKGVDQSLTEIKENQVQMGNKLDELKFMIIKEIIKK